MAHIISVLIIYIVVIIFLFLFINTAFFSPDAPFLPIRSKNLKTILESLDIRSGQTVYDLGCGDGRLLSYAAQSFPETNFTGVESNFIAYLIAHIRTLRFSNVRIIRKNFFKAKLTDADRVYIYLFPKVMPKLLSKFEAELKPGAKVLSCDFYFEAKEPIKSFAENGHKFYIYSF